MRTGGIGGDLRRQLHRGSHHCKGDRRRGRRGRGLGSSLQQAQKSGGRNKKELLAKRSRLTGKTKPKTNKVLGATAAQDVGTGFRQKCNAHTFRWQRSSPRRRRHSTERFKRATRGFQSFRLLVCERDLTTTPRMHVAKREAEQQRVRMMRARNTMRIRAGCGNGRRSCLLLGAGSSADATSAAGGDETDLLSG